MMEHLTLYLERSRDGSRLYELWDDSWILFCKLLKLNERRVTYLGSITLRRSDMVRDLETRARGLTEWPWEAKSDIVIQKDDARLIRLEKLVKLEDVRA